MSTEETIANILNRCHNGHGARFESSCRNMIILGKYDAGTVWWNDTPEYTGSLAPDDIIFIDDRFFRIRTIEDTNALTVCPLTPEESDRAFWLNLGEFDDLKSDQDADGRN